MTDFKDEQEYHDFRLRSYLNIPEQSELESLSDIKLAEKQSKLTAEKTAQIIIQNEWRRREKHEHHNLNRKLIEIQNNTNKKLLIKQHELNKKISQSQNRTIILASLIGIVGVAVGVILTNMTIKPQAPYEQQTIIQAPAKEDHLSDPKEDHLSNPNEKIVKADILATETEYVEQGDRYRKEGHLFQAVNAYRRALTNGPAHHNLYRNLAITLSELRLLDEAFIELKKALDLAPDDVLLHVELGILYLVKNKFDLAEKELATALSNDPAYADAYYYLGEVFFQTERYTLAWYAMEIARKLGHHGIMLSEKLQAAGAEPSRYPWDSETTLISFREVILSTQIEAELFLSHYRQGDLSSDLLISDWGKKVSPSGFVGSFTPTELHNQIAAALLLQKPFAEPVIVETENGYHVVQRVLPFDLASWKEFTHEKRYVKPHNEQFIVQENIATVPLCVENEYIDLQKRRVYAGAYVKKKDAVNAVNKLREEDFPAFCWKTTGKDNHIIYNAVAGQFASFVEAESVLQKLKEKGYPQAFISRREQ